MVNFITTLAATLIGTCFGGVVTLYVNKKFEYSRIRMNNINDMKNDVSPATRNYMGALKSIEAFLEANELREKLCEQSDLINLVEKSLFEFNMAVDTYEIELSSMLDFHENILIESAKFLELFKSYDILNDVQTHIFELMPPLHKLMDMVATFSEEVSEIKRLMLCGKVDKYWKKDIFEKEKKTEKTITQNNYNEFKSYQK